MIEEILFYFKNYLLLNEFVKVSGILGVFIFKLDMNDSVTTLGLGRKEEWKQKTLHGQFRFLKGYKVCYVLYFEIHLFLIQIIHIC